MAKNNLKDITFLIPVRIDSKERLDNLNMVITFIKKNFQSNIFLLEADKKEKIGDIVVDKKIFIEDLDSVFHRTKYLNKLIRLTQTPYLAIWDTDVIIPPDQILQSVELLRNNSVQFALPYDGRFYNIPPMFNDLFKSTLNIDIFNKNTEKFPLMFGSMSVGGAFMVNREAYIEAGLENENFYGWGPEDFERVKRWEILGHKVVRVNGPLFHLYHPRNENSRYFNITSKKDLLKEFLKICQMTTEDLKLYIKSFSWMLYIT